MGLKRLLLFFSFVIIFSVIFEQLLIHSTHKNFHEYFYSDYYSGTFPEEMFSCRTEQEKEYKQLIGIGYKQMKQKRIVICGLARDTALSLDIMMQRLEKTGKLFKDYKVIIFENDSVDGTRKKLKTWQQCNQHVTLLECGVPDCKLGNKPLYEYGLIGGGRIQRMAQFRNYYLQVVQNKFSDFDYMMIVDMDLKGPWSNDGIAHTVAQKEWDAVAAFGLHSFPGTAGMVLTVYDALAYVSKEGSYTDPQDFVINYFKMNFYDLLGIQKGDPMIPVKSAFSGFALYKINSIKGSSYFGNICEHIGLHKQMAQNGHDKLFINPSLLLLSGHQGPINMLNLIMQ